jgi:K+ transporter
LACITYSRVLPSIAGGVFWPVFLVANLAALIASRTMTVAIFQCLKQSIALGCFPRLKIVHTSRKFMAKIYIPVVNWFLLVSCLGFIVLFRSVYDVGNAYGNNNLLNMLFIQVVLFSPLLNMLSF